MRPSFDELLAYAANELDATRMSEVRQHLASNTTDAGVVREIERTLGVMRGDDSVAPPEAVMARARALFHKAVRVNAPTLTEKLRRIVAQLTFDNRRQPALAGYRSVAQAIVLSFAVDGVEVDLQIEPPAKREADQWRMMGQVNADRLPAGIALRDAQTGTVVREAVSETHGGFRFAAPAGKYEIAIRIGDDEVVLPDVEF